MLLWEVYEVIRAEILDNAKKCVCGDREQDYGSPECNFYFIADLWSLYLGLDEQLSPMDVAAMMILLKMARMKNGHAKEDNWIDIAGYAACGGEMEAVEISENCD